MRYRYEATPHPHVYIDEIVDPAAYAKIRFPDDLVSSASKWGITATDPQYQDVLRDPAWCALHNELAGGGFVLGVLREFAADMRRAGCRVDPDCARVTSFIESREEKERAVLDADGDPNALFTRLDFQSKGQGQYREFVHLDWARRIVGGILFFSDADEEGLEGGELALYRDRDFRDDRWCHDPEPVAMFRPKHNTGVLFLNSNTGFHGPRGITALRGRRRWLYYAISSRLDIWPHQPRSAATSRAS